MEKWIDTVDELLTLHCPSTHVATKAIDRCCEARKVGHWSTSSSSAIAWLAQGDVNHNYSTASSTLQQTSLGFASFRVVLWMMAMGGLRRLDGGEV